ncbi:hypothetical protein ONZ45_g4204 [Pleurotus djamor]|nr:hypothetical protein ONZ45_g4204 [Pleurotus djamor]
MSFAKISYSTLNVSIGSTTYRLFSNDVSRGNHRSLRVHGGPLRASNHVYHATITQESSIKQEVVVKLATSQEELVRMQREAGLYEKELKSLCGNVVPNYHGFYQRQPDSEVIGCIILEKLDLVPPPADVIEFSLTEFKVDSASSESASYTKLVSTMEAYAEPETFCPLWGALGSWISRTLFATIALGVDHN